MVNDRVRKRESARVEIHMKIEEKRARYHEANSGVLRSVDLLSLAIIYERN